MYTDLLTKIKNAQAVKKENIKVHYSKMDEEVVSVLVKQNYLDSYEKKGRNPKRILDIKLKYNEGKGAVSDVKLLSRPSRRLHVGYKEIKPVRHGYGLLVLSTPKGIMTGQDAKKAKVGGTLLFQIW